MTRTGLYGASALEAQRMWVEGHKADAIAAACSCTVGAVYAAARRCGFPARRRRGDTVHVATDPTPLGIAAECLRIRAAHMAAKRREVPGV